MSLSSLIVQREVATMRQVEEALARQVIYGGDLVTNLLEVAKVDEAVLVELLAESMRLAPAPAGHLPAATERVKGLVPREVAVERMLAPLDTREGKLVVAVAEPLSRDVEEQLRFALGMGIEQRAAPAVRVLEAVARAYGVPLERRMLRLIARLGGGAMELGSTPPPLGVMPSVTEPPRPPSSPPSRSIPPAAGPAVAGRLVPQALGHRKTSTGFPAVRGPMAETVPEQPTALAPVQAVAAVEAPAPVAAPEPTPAPAPVAAPASALVAAPAPATEPEPASFTPDSRTLLQRDTLATPRAGRRRRGPITVEAARHEAEEAEDRDALLDLFFDFSQQFFDYSALFLVHGDIAEGRDAFGSGAHREKVLGIGVPLDMPSMIATAREQRLPVVARPPSDGLDAVLLGDLHRGRDAEVAIVPLVVRTRAVAILIGDCGDAGIERSSMQQVVAFSGVVGKAFERIIVRRKLSGFVSAAGETAPSSRVTGSMVPPKRSSFPARAAGRTPPPPRMTSPMGSAVSAPAPVAASAPAPAPVPMPVPAPVAAPGPAPVAAPGPAPVAAPAPSSAPASSAPTSRAPPTSKAPRRPNVPTVTTGLPPPAANVAVVRKISGPPIPREEPDTPGVAHATMDTSPPRSPSPGPWSAPPSPRPPRVEPDTPRVSVPARPASANPARMSEPTPASASTPELQVIETDEIDPDGSDGSTLFEELGWASASPPTVELPSSASIAVPPHKPPAPVAASIELPSVMVDDLDRELLAMVDRLASGDVDDFAEAELLRLGERAVRALMSRFPGPIAFSRARIATAINPPKASDCGPILKLVARERRVALPFVLERLASNDPEIRGWATHLLCELPYTDSIPRLLPRLRDQDPSTRVSAALAFVAIARAAPAPVRDAVVGLAHASDPQDRIAAMHVIAKLREATYVPELVHALGDTDDTVVDAARDALVQVTRHDLGTDARLWLRWWEQNAAKHRIEWLIDALTHDVSEIRKSAAEELRVLTKEYFGYADDLPPRDRDRAQQRYRDWWTLEGRGRFRHS
jgi:hypothetical protein